MCNWVRGIADVRVNVIDHEVGGNTGAAGPPRRQYWAPPFRARPRRTGRPGSFGHLRSRAAQASAGRRRHGRHPRRGPAVQARQGPRAGHPFAPAAGRVRRGRVGSAAGGSAAAGAAAPTSGSTAPRKAAPGSATAGRTAAPAACGSTGTTRAPPAAATGAAAGCPTAPASGSPATAASRAPTAGPPGRERASRSQRLGRQRSRSRRFGRTSAGLPGRDDGDPEVPRHPAATPERAASRQEPG